jgi:SAM-dependent MidA family methyltransferase
MKTPAELIRREIAERGAMPFVRFMELALYAPDCGYYEVEKGNVGRSGDFYTSVSVGNLFGELLAFQFAEWLEELRPANGKFQIIEAGAHDGKLAADILAWLQIQRPELFSKIEYGIIEPSARRQEWQRETLKIFAPRIRWFSDIEDLKGKFQNPKPDGIIFSNELLDAFPVRRFGWDAGNKNWFEWGVAIDGEKFIWTRMPALTGDPQIRIDAPPELLAVLPDGHSIEISTAAENWWREASDVLGNGRLMTMDYGFIADEFFSPARPQGTLRAYFSHHVSSDILANVGEQDLTAHVNFHAIRKAGEDAGLLTEYFCPQARFLTEILSRAAKANTFGPWDNSDTRQFQTLTHPEHLGRAFRVLIQLR